MKYIYIFLVLMAVLVWLIVFEIPDGRLHLIACDVGQGDASLVIYGSFDILIDGGPANAKVLGCLSKYMPFWDRKIEVVFLSHPQLDHFGGLIEVFKRYKVENFVASEVENSNLEYQVLKKEVGGSRTKVINPREGTVIRYGLMHLDIVNPLDELFAGEEVGKDKNVLGTFTAREDLNDYSIVSTLKFRGFSALFTGDISPKVERELLARNLIGPVNYLKVPHHGSKNGIIAEVLDAARPSLAVISVGKNNSYGHPNPEVIKLLSDKVIKVLRTDEGGDIEIVTDGEKWMLR